jgi:hypothetical protein
MDVPSNSQEDKKRLLATVRILELCLKDVDTITKPTDNDPNYDEADYVVKREHLITTAAKAILEAVHEPQYSMKSSMRDFVKEALQIASDTIEINKEATEAGRRFEIDIPENTEISWDSADFSAFMLKLTKVRRALLLGMPMIGDLAFDLARIELHNQFDKKRRKKRKK